MVKLLEYTISDVSQHKTKEDAWIIINGWVLDITHFFELHPGGSHILEPYIGKDASNSFMNSEIHVHGKAAFDLLEKFKIGFISGTKNQQEIVDAQHSIKSAADFGVDISRGLLWQMAFIGDKYEDFLQNVLITQSESLRFFDHPLLEFFSRSPWWSVPAIWLPCASIMFFWALQAGLPAFMIPFWIIAAPFVWNFFEYFIHKHIFHMEPKSDTFRVIHFMLHGYHHIAPMDRTRLTFPPVPAFLFGGVIYSSFSWFLPRYISISLMASIMLGYICYDLTHYFLHHASLSNLEFFSTLKTHHLYHHYKNGNSNFGITMPLFDWIMGTYDKTMLVGREKAKKGSKIE